MKGNILSLYFRQLLILCAGGKKDSFEGFTTFQVCAEKNAKKKVKNENGIYRMVSVSLSFSWLLV